MIYYRRILRRQKGKVPSKVHHQGITKGEHASDHLPRRKMGYARGF